MKDKWKKFGKKAWELFWSDPSAFLTRVKANILMFVLPEKDCEIELNGVRFQIESSFAPMMKEMCYGFYENELTELLKKYIRKGDICVDAGANIGYISAFMLGLVGESGEVHSFEPVPEYHERLTRVKTDNPRFSLTVNETALGDFEGSANICVTNRDNIGWNTMVPNFMTKSTIKKEIEIPVNRLDKYLRSKKIDNVRLIKIDTEGYEFPVLKGLSKYFDKCRQLPVLIVEIAPNAYPKLGVSLIELAEYMESFGFISHDVTTGRPVDIRKLSSSSNVVFLHPRYH